MKPSLSVLLLCWNHAPFIEQCITGLANQTDRKFEVIFLDNVSTDGSYELAEKLFVKHGIEATMLRNEVPQGISKNFNKLLAHSNGYLVCPLSTDDWYRPRYVEAMKSVAENYPLTAWFYGTRSSFSKEEGEIFEVHDYVDGDVREFFLKGLFRVNLNGIAYKRAALNAVGGWDETLRIEDIDLVFRMSETGTCHRVDEPLATYRSHPGGASKNFDFMVGGVSDFFKKHANHFPRNGKPALADTIRQFAAWCIDVGDLKQARRLLWRSFLIDPRNPNILRTSVYLVRRAIGRLRPTNSQSPT